MQITGIEEFKKKLDQIEQKLIPRAIAGTINDTLYEMRSQVIKSREGIAAFDRPTPYIKASVNFTRAREDNLTGKVNVTDPNEYSYDMNGAVRSDQSDKPAPQAIPPEIFGGPRPPKASETLLRGLGIMGRNQFLVPGKYAPLDKYGNISGGDMEKILSAAKLSENWAGHTSNQTARSKKRKGFLGSVYVIPFKGIFWRVTPQTSYPLIHFTDKVPEYGAGLFEFYSIAENTAKSYFAKAWKANAKAQGIFK